MLQAAIPYGTLAARLCPAALVLVALHVLSPES